MWWPPGLICAIRLIGSRAYARPADELEAEGKLPAAQSAVFPTGSFDGDAVVMDHG